MTALEPIPPRSPLTRRALAGLTRTERRQLARNDRALAAIEHRTMVRLANVQSEGMVSAEKLREVDRLAHTAMSGQAFLRGWANHLAGNDPMMLDELRFFSDQAKLGKAEVIADAIDSFRCQ